MPEGPSIVILKEEIAQFTGKKIRVVSGNSKIGLARLKNQKVIEFKSWGKHFIICFKNFAVRIHMMLFGSYRVNERREMTPRIALRFSNGELNFYNCSVKIIEEDLNTVYDWERDTMSDKWNPAKALQSIKLLKKILVCDVLLDQNIFAGSGNIIKNEVLFRLKIHPASLIEHLPAKKQKELVKETRLYCFDFYKWKKKYELKKHWQIYRSRECPRCHIPVVVQYMGKHKRKTFFCNNCQVLYKKSTK